RKPVSAPPPRSGEGAGGGVVGGTLTDRQKLIVIQQHVNQILSGSHVGSRSRCNGRVLTPRETAQPFRISEQPRLLRQEPAAQSLLPVGRNSAQDVFKTGANEVRGRRGFAE